MLEIEHLSYRYKPQGPWALKDISLTLPSGKIGVLLGCNGAGKSTLLKAVASLLDLQEGNLLLDNEALRYLSPKERAKRISYVPQSPEISEMTVFDAILSGRIPYFTFRPSDADLQKVSQEIQAFGLEDLALKNLSELSGGQRQRVTLARALAQEPKLLLLDEPNSSLDISSQLTFFAQLKDISQQQKISVLISLHSVNQALDLGDQFFLLKQGSLVAQGDKTIITPATLKSLYYVDSQMVTLNGSQVVVFRKGNGNEKH
ncbi:MAG: ABC transporter ATP-binding protein [Bacilli bacterium]|jgi:iron complex transport system ATP-binding protein|nr:ABC transporter ATP-binding protein [Bacilli bacterium]